MSTDITASGDVVVNVEFVGKKGETKIYSVNLPYVKNAPAIPTPYQLLNKKSFLVQTTAILFGETIFTFKIPMEGGENFKKVRILHLSANDINPSGFEWNDCTILSDAIDSADNSVSQETRVRLEKFLPDPQKKLASCILNNGESDNYFVLSVQNEEAPVKPFTQMDVRLVDERPSAKAGETTFLMLFKNTGKSRIEEVNFYSHFDSNAKVISVKPKQGVCKKSKWGSSYGSMVCYIGSLAAGAEAIVEFQAASSGMSGTPTPQKLNKGWTVWGFIKERADSPNWAANRFVVEPLLNASEPAENR